MNEMWRAVSGHPQYEVSDIGRVASLHAQERRELKAHDDGRGYPTVYLYTEGQAHRRRIHRLVAAAFLGPCPVGQEVRHLDGVKVNNTVENLAYGTRSENEFDKVRHGTHQQARKTHCRRGHAYDDENTLRYGAKRDCRTCQNARARARRAREAAAA